jgi:hypothetical protein
MKSAKNYFRRPRTAREDSLVHSALRMAHELHGVTGGPVDISIRHNRRNPNGFNIRIDENGKETISRSLNLGWAKRHGYDVR